MDPAMLKALFAITLLCAFAPAGADVVVQDDIGNTVRLAQPAKRIITLAPHMAETLFAAGAGSKLVGAVEYSDHPEEAKKVPRVGGYSRFDLEAVVALKDGLPAEVGGGPGGGHQGPHAQFLGAHRQVAPGDGRQVLLQGLEQLLALSLLNGNPAVFDFALGGAHLEPAIPGDHEKDASLGSTDGPGAVAARHRVEPEMDARGKP